MLKLTGTIALSAALSAALLLGVATAATGKATPIVNGQGNWETTIGTVGFEVSLVELPDGSLQGRGTSYLHGEDGIGWFHFEVLDYMDLGGDILIRGVITKTFNSGNIVEGSLTALVVRDNGNGGGPPDGALSASGLPPFVTIEQIAASLPPFRFPLAVGDFRIH